MGHPILGLEAEIGGNALDVLLIAWGLDGQEMFDLRDVEHLQP